MSRMMMSLENESMLLEAKRDIKSLLSSESRKKVETIIQEVEKLSKFDRLLFYLELPSNQSNTAIDPLRGPLNPLGSRTEIQLTITWIKTHLEEDQQVSLPKHEVYDEYIDYCSTNNLKPLSTADFGKVMKQVYPQVRPRRLGTRGNSRYCYAGLKKKTRLEDPLTPDFNFRKTTEQTAPDAEDSVSVSASYLIREWVEKLLGVKFEGLKELAYYLLDKMYVDNKSYAAYALLSGKKNVKCTSQNDTLEHSQAPHLLNHVKERENKRKSQDFDRYESNINMMSYEEPESRKVLKLRNDEGQQQANDLAPDTDLLLKSNQQPPPGEIKLEDGGEVPILPVYDDVKSSEVDMVVVKKDEESLWNPPVVCSTPNSSGQSLVPIIHNNNEELWLPVSSSTGGVEVPPPPPQPVKSLWGNEAPDEEIGTYIRDSSSSLENDDKLSQLRQLLEKNLKSPTVGGNAFKSTLSKEDEPDNWGSEPPPGGGNSSLSSRRRVSFNPILLDNNPGTATNRKRNYGFQPISPLQASSSQPPSPTASPFISPRSTPVPSSRSRHSSGNALSLLPSAPRNYGSNGSDISRAATFGSTSECSTPFISPQATPVHFPRSRHNSAQGRLCRSRHSSGLGTQHYKYPPNNFSPIALSNLNNPFSPGPGTPMMEDSYGAPGPYFDSSSEALRSRHSSGGSEQSIQSAPISPTSNPLLLQGSGLEPRVRQRHASAGTVPSYGHLPQILPPTAPPPPLPNAGLILDGKESHDKLLLGASLGGGKKDHPPDNSMPDDLEMTVRALKDFDNEFSQFCTDDNAAS